MIQWPRLIREIKVYPHLGEYPPPNETVVNSWDDVQYLPWIMSMNLKRVFLTRDEKYIVGEKQSGHVRYVARLYPPNKRDQNV